MKKIQTQSGFSILELLVSFALFSTITVITLGAMLSLLDASDRSKNLNRAMDTLNFALESMSREIRVGTNIDCDGIGDCTNGTSLSFVTSEGEPMTYSYNASTDQIERFFRGNLVRMTGAGLVITDMDFYVTGTDDYLSGDDEQPKVVITVRGTAGGKAQSQVDFDIQTTVTQRFPDI